MSGTFRVSKRAVRRAFATTSILLCATLCGCEPELTPERYGKVIYNLPHIEGADRPYPLPQLEELSPSPTSEPADGQK